jgi:SAM-dependent methyltransferase
MEKNFDLYGKYYDLLYASKKYDEEAIYIAECMRKYGSNVKDVLEFGSGTGIHGLMLQHMGFEVFGLERSQQMVDQAKSNGFACMQADISDFKLEKSFDVVIALFHVISYLNDNDALVKTFRNAFNHLASNGLFIFDIWYSPAVYHLKPETRVKKVENEEISVWRMAEPVEHVNSNVVDVNYSILVKNKTDNSWMEFEEKHPMRHFSIPEIKLLAELTGFELVKAEEFLTGNQPSKSTWGVNFILKKG